MTYSKSKTQEKMTGKELTAFHDKLLEADSSILENPVKNFNHKAAIIKQIIFLLTKEDKKADKKVAGKKLKLRKVRFVVRYKKSDKIIIKAKTNPKREGSQSRERFELYKKYNTVGSYLEHGGKTYDISRDMQHKYIALAI